MDYLLEARGLSKKRDGKSILSSIDLEVRAGSCLGLVGPVNSGKSKLVEVLSCQMPPDTGELFINDMDAKIYDQRVKKYLGVLPENDDLDREISPFLNVSIFGSFFGIDPKATKKRAHQLFRDLKIEDLENSNFENLTLGDIKKIGLCRALINNPKILILDEPTANLSFSDKKQLWQLLKNLKHENMAIIIATEDLREVEEICDQVIVMNHGSVIAKGEPKDLINNEVGKEIIEFKIDSNDINYYIDRLKSEYEYKILSNSVCLFLKDGQSHLDAIKYFSSENIVIRKATLADVYLKRSNQNYYQVNV